MTPFDMWRAAMLNGRPSEARAIAERMLSTTLTPVHLGKWTTLRGVADGEHLKALRSIADCRAVWPDQFEPGYII